MAFWSKIAARLDWRNSPERPGTSLANPDSWLNVFWGSNKSDSGITITPQTALTIATVYQCVALLTGDFAKVPTDVYKKNDVTGGRERDLYHAAHPLLRRKSNRALTAGQFKKTILFHTLLYGNGYAWITRNGRMEPDELLILNPERTEPVWVEKDLFYVTYIDDVKKVLAADEVFHLRGVGYDGIKGYSIIDYAVNSLGLTLAAEKYGSKHFSNGTKVSGVLQYPGRLTAEAAKGLQKSFQERHEGIDNAHKTILLEEGAKFIPTSQTPNEAQFIELRQFQRKEIAAWFNIPPSKLGDPDSVSYNSLEQWNQAYLESALDPWLFAFEEEAYDKLLTERQKRAETHFIEFNRNALLRTDLEARYRAYALGRQWGWYSINDIRAKENEERIGPEGDKYLTPSNMMDSEMLLLPPAEQPGAPKPKEEEKPPVKEKKSDDFALKSQPLVNSVVSRAGRRLVESGRKAIVKDDWRDAIANRLNDHLTVLTTDLAPVMEALSLSGQDARDAALGVVEQFDERLTNEAAGIAGRDDSREVRIKKWDAWAARFLGSSVPQLVNDIVSAYKDN